MCTQSKKFGYLCQKYINMQIITHREFRANQKKYFDLAEKETILIPRRGKKTIKISVATEDEYLTPYEMECIQRGMKEYEEGKTVKIKDINNIWESIL